MAMGWTRIHVALALAEIPNGGRPPRGTNGKRPDPEGIGASDAPADKKCPNRFPLAMVD